MRWAQAAAARPCNPKKLMDRAAWRRIADLPPLPRGRMKPLQGADQEATIMVDGDSGGRIRTERSGAAGVVVIDNPARHNAVSKAMWLALPAAIGELAADPSVRAIVLRGAGDGAFVSGADISEFAEVRRDAENSRAYEAANEAAFAAIRAAPKPTVAMIRRFCIGGGMGLAAACDIRIASRDAVFAVPAARLGLAYPPEAVADFVRLIGAARTKDLIFTARRVDAAEAAAIGFVDRLVEPADLEAATADYVAAVAANAPLTQAAIKAAVAAIVALPGTADWAAAHTAAERCFDSADYAEGRAAFLGKRAPVFSGG